MGNRSTILNSAVIRGRGSCKTLDRAGLEVCQEMAVCPPATPDEVLKFCRVQIRRCAVNLENAKKRGDTTAVAHLERKLAVYQYLYQQVDMDNTRECPECKTHSVDIFGHCQVCGKNW